MAETKAQIAEILTAVASLAWGNGLMAARVPRGKAVYERMKNPQPGDLVVEVTHREWSTACVGTLVKVVDEPVIGRADLLERAPLDQYYYVKPLAGGPVVRWSNCSFIAIPRTRREAYHFGDTPPSGAAAEKMDEVRKR